MTTSWKVAHALGNACRKMGYRRVRVACGFIFQMKAERPSGFFFLKPPDGVSGVEVTFRHFGKGAKA